MAKSSKSTIAETQKETTESSASDENARVVGGWVLGKPFRYAGRVKRDESGRIVKKEGGTVRDKKPKVSPKVDAGRSKRDDTGRVVGKGDGAVRHKKPKAPPKVTVSSPGTRSASKVHSGGVVTKNDAVFVMGENGSEFVVLNSETGSLKELGSAEFKAGVERMALYHAKSKALFVTFIKGSHKAEFTGVMAGNVRKNKIKNKDKHNDSCEVKKAH